MTSAGEAGVCHGSTTGRRRLGDFEALTAKAKTARFRDHKKGDCEPLDLQGLQAST